MKITVEQASFMKALSHIQSIVEKKQTIPILSNVLMQAENGKLTLKATDNEIEILETISVEVEEAGSVTAPARKLYEIVSKLSDGAQIKMALADNHAQVNLTSGRSRFALPTLNPEDFPSVEQQEMPVQFSLPASELLYLINNTSFSVSVEETRYNLNGIYLHTLIEEEQPLLRAVATDGHRLACADISLPEGAEKMAGIIIPRKTILEISKLFAGLDEDVEVCVSENQICFKRSDLTLISRLIDGTYPDYEKVIPKDNDKILEVESDALAKVIARVSVVSEKSRGIKIALQNNVLKAYMTNPEEGTAEDELEVSYAGDVLETGFNYRSLLDILAQLKGTMIQISFLEASSPIIVKDAKKGGLLFVLMPMRV